MTGSGNGAPAHGSAVTEVGTASVITPYVPPARIRLLEITMHRSFDKAVGPRDIAFAGGLFCRWPQMPPSRRPVPARSSPDPRRRRATFLLPADGPPWCRQRGDHHPPEADRLARRSSTPARRRRTRPSPKRGRCSAHPKFFATDAAPRDGWEQRRFYDYDIPANAKRVVNSAAYRKDKHWTVIAMDVDQAIAEKRGSQFAKINQRFQPAGYTRETFAGRTAHKLDAARLQQVSDFIEQMRKDFEVPGVAIGIVQDGKVVLSRGYGVRELGKPDPVDGDTCF
jgi:hypothetical protein